MKNKYNESTAQRPDGDRLIDAAVVPIDLPLLMKQIKEAADGIISLMRLSFC